MRKREFLLLYVTCVIVKLVYENVCVHGWWRDLLEGGGRMFVSSSGTMLQEKHTA